MTYSIGSMHKIAITTFAVIFSILVPIGASGQSFLANQLLQRAEARRIARIQQDAPKQQTQIERTQPAQQIRLGRSIVNIMESPRRRQIRVDGVVTDVLDGSVMAVREANGEVIGIRTLGSEAPKIIRPDGGVECYGLEARDALARLVLGQEIQIERDEAYQRDSNRRLLRYLKVGNQDVGAWMIWNGYAFVDREHDYDNAERYQSLEDISKEEDRGLWSGKCNYDLDDDELLEILE